MVTRAKGLMIGLGVALLGGALAVSAAIARPARRGKVVRVERPRLSARESLRACMFNAGQEEKLVCFGMIAPEVGDMFTILDENGYRGRARATKVEIGEYDNCKLGASHDVQFEYEDRATPAHGGAQPRYWSSGLALRGVDADAAVAKVINDHSRLKSPSGKDETLWMAIDLTGDGFPDMISTWYDGCENPSFRPTPPANKSIKPLCLDYWLKEDGEWQRKTTDSYYVCM